MDTKRWSTLWVFVGGCLTGAVFIGLRAGGEDSRGPARAALAPTEFDAPQPPPVASAAMRASDAAPSTVAAPQPDNEERAPAVEAGNSVSDVLGRLEAEYRQRGITPPTSDERTVSSENKPPDNAAQPNVHSAVSEVTAPAPTSAPAAVVSAAPIVPSEVAGANEAPTEPRVAALTVELKPALSGSEEAPVRVASAQSEQSSSALDKSQQQVRTQMQQLTALQQATLVQQSAILQYLQLLALSGSPRVARSGTLPRQRLANGGRIVPTLPSSISDTDNPWGFELQPSLSVR